MPNTLAELILMRGLQMRRKRLQELKERVAKGRCIIDGCDCKVRSRGLCEQHRQLWYYEFNKKSDAEKQSFENECIREGLILINGEQDKFVRISSNKNPFQNVG